MRLTCSGAAGNCDGFVTSAQLVQSENGPAATGSGSSTSTGSGSGSGPAAATTGMGYWTEDDLPFYYGLARTFRWLITGFPRAWVPPSPIAVPHRRTAHGLIDDSPSDLLDYPRPGPSSTC